MLICVVLVVAGVLGALPWLEMGVNDDFSFNWVARTFASTGHLTYDGWAAAMIGVQAWWAGWLIRLFGFSFTLVRLSTLPMAAGCALLLYALGRRAGLNPPYALFGALSVALSPVFLPMAASFMTDVPGFFFWLACVYCAVRAGRAAGRGAACAWLAAAAVTGVAGGTIRQIVWAAPLLSIPTVAWLRRRGCYTFSALLWFASVVPMVLLLGWFVAQPYASPIAETGKFALSLPVLRGETEAVVRLIFCCLLLILPVLVAALASWRDLVRAPGAAALGVASCAALLAVLHLYFGDFLLLGNIVTKYGLLDQGTELMGIKPVVLPVFVRQILGLAIVVAAGLTGAQIWRSRPAAVLRSEEAGPLGRLVLLMLPPSLVYAAAVLFRAVNDRTMFDRYAIVLLPVLVIPLLWHCQQRVRQTPAAAAWAAIGVFACYGVAATHDYFAAGRARLQSATALTTAGVPRTRLTAGLEYDGWTELERSGHIQARKPDEDRDYPIPPYWFWEKTPSIDPQYFVVYSRIDGLQDSRFPPVPYTTWLPPFHRRVFTQVMGP